MDGIEVFIIHVVLRLWRSGVRCVCEVSDPCKRRREGWKRVVERELEILEVEERSQSMLDSWYLPWALVKIVTVLSMCLK